MSPDQSKRAPFSNLGDPRGTLGEERAADEEEQRGDRYPEAEADLHEQHVGELHGPVIGEKGDIDPSTPRAADALIGFKQPPVKPREVQ